MSVATPARRTRRNAPLAANAAPAADLIRRTIDSLYRGPAWHGPSVTTALRGVTAEEAAWRPAPGRNTIWELTLHLAFSRHRLVGRLAGRSTERFPRPMRVDWWPKLPSELTAAAWEADLSLLEGQHARLLAAVAAAPAARFRVRRKAMPWTVGEELLGVALHDAYHAGQIVLVRRLRAAS